MTCPHCGAPLLEGDKFCGACGQSIEAPPAEEKVSPPATQPPEPSPEPPPTVTDPDAVQARGWRLLGIEGEFEGEETQLLQDLVLGRDPSADIRLSNPRASRQHARILRQPDGYRLQDEGSSNGTWLNGERVAGTVLISDGDEIRIEDSVWRVMAASGARDRAVAGSSQPRGEPARPGQPAEEASPARGRGRWLVIGLVLLLVLTCVCCLLSGLGEELIYELGI